MEGVEARENLYGFEFREHDKRRVPACDRSFQAKQLWQRHHEIVNLAARGFKQKEIAEILNITPQTVCNTLNGELGMRKLSDIRKGRDEEAIKVSEKIRVLTDKALATYHEIFDSDQTTMSEKKAVADTVVLELSGLRVPTKTQATNAVFRVTPEELELFKKRGIAAAREAGLIAYDEEAEVVDAKDS